MSIFSAPSPRQIYYFDLHLERTSAKIYVYAKVLTEFRYFLILAAILSVPIRMQNRDKPGERGGGRESRKIQVTGTYRCYVFTIAGKKYVKRDRGMK